MDDAQHSYWKQNQGKLINILPQQRDCKLRESKKKINH